MIDESVKPRRWKVFLLFMALAAIPSVLIAWDAISNPVFAAGLLIWNLTPVFAAVLVFRLISATTGWGWGLACGLFSGYVLASISSAPGSTSAITFLWIPVWDLVVVGPIGGMMGFLANKLTRTAQRPPQR